MHNPLDVQPTLAAQALPLPFVFSCLQVSPCNMLYQPGDFVIHYSGAFGRAEYYTNGSLVKRPYKRLFRYVSSFFQNNVTRSE